MTPNHAADPTPEKPFNLSRSLQYYFKRELVPLLADLRLAIFLLLAIAIFSVSGTVIEQGQPLAFYQAKLSRTSGFVWLFDLEGGLGDRVRSGLSHLVVFWHC